MSSVIGGMEDTIAKTMAEIGWPGADQVNEPEIEDEANSQVAGISEETESEIQEGADEVDESEAAPSSETEESEQGNVAASEGISQDAYRPKWKKAALAILDELAAADPEKAAQLIAEDKRREENFHKGIEQYRTGHQESKEWADVVAPYRATIDRFQVKPQEAVRTLLATDNTLRYGQRHEKVGLMFQVMQNYGIDPADIVGVYNNVHNQQQNGEPLDPRIQQMQQRLSQFEQQQMSAQQAAQAEQQRQLEAQNKGIQEAIQKFSEDPDHEYFELLKPAMGSLLQSGVAKDLDEAYDMAMKAHPQTAQIWIAQQQKQWADSRKAAAAKAKTVTNVRSNGRASQSVATKAATMDETIKATAEKLGLI